jgi:hypothetical protein
MKLERIGYWSNGTQSRWPDVSGFVDETWSDDLRDDVADYLKRGFVARAYLGKSECRIYRETVGSLELSDGVFVWPEGLAHYVQKHSVRLPTRFLTHVQAQTALLDAADIDDSWWKAQHPQQDSRQVIGG